MAPSRKENVEVSQETMDRWYDSPLAFAEEALHFTPDKWQEQTLRLVEESPRKGLRIALMACKGPGKSAVLAVLALWFLATRPYANIIVTSITGKNLEDGLWKELAKWGEPLKDTFEFEKKRITHRKFSDRWFISARTWPKDANAQEQAESLAGVHEDFIMFILDEVSEYPEGVVAAAEAALSTGKEMMLLAAGNCTRTTGSPLYRFATSDIWSNSNPHGWHVVRISGDPDDPNRSARVSEAWAKNLIRLWGRDHPIVRTNVLAEFPLSGMGTLLTLEDIEASFRRNPPPANWQNAAKIIGVDVARWGVDKTVFFPRQGLVAFQPHIYPFAERNFFSQARDLILMADRFQMDAGFIEINGLGSGLWDAVHQLDKNHRRWIGVDVTMTEGIDPRYQNMRAQMHFTAAEWVKTGGSLPQMPELTIEGSSTTYDFHKQTGKIVISGKDEIKERVGHSPDDWDSFCLTFAYPVSARAAMEQQYRPSQGKPRWDFNPFRRQNRV